LHWVEVDVPADVRDGLEGDAAHRRVPKPETDDIAHLVIVDIPLDRRDQDDIELRGGDRVRAS
jgi:hypothetical protein